MKKNQLFRLKFAIMSRNLKKIKFRSKISVVEILVVATSPIAC